MRKPCPRHGSVPLKLRGEPPLLRDQYGTDIMDLGDLDVVGAQATPCAHHAIPGRGFIAYACPMPVNDPPPDLSIRMVGCFYPSRTTH
jgi:hypothetical protein